MAMRASRSIVLAATAALALAACDRADEEGNLASLDNQLTGNDADPALTSALQDQIAVDRTLSQQSNRNAVRPSDAPVQAQYPAGTGAAAPSGGPGACGGNAKLDHNPAWARRLPAVFPVYPGGQVTEAAGSRDTGCRVATFTTGDNFQRVLDWYHTRAVRAGYSSEHQLRGSDHILAGANERDGGAFYLIVTPGRAGSQAALIANKGR